MVNNILIIGNGFDLSHEQRALYSTCQGVLRFRPDTDTHGHAPVGEIRDFAAVIREFGDRLD